jgi:hypothetical protein
LRFKEADLVGEALISPSMTSAPVNPRYIFRNASPSFD